ncbi:MAG: polysaccharide deacetylase family protein [Thermodesulfobacteriota bacterium]
MNYLQFISHSKGLSKLPYRFLLILKRFGFTDKRLKKFISQLENLFRPYAVRPTIFITAKILEKRPHILDWFKGMGCDTAIHGYTHINYNELNAEEQSDHMEKAKHLISNGKPQSIGFRAPYLSRNSNTLSAMKSNNLSWSSHQPVIWDCFKSPNFQKSEIEDNQRVLTTLYNPKLANKFPVVPYFTDGFLEMPVSLPDDEILIDRFHILNADKLFEIWNNILLQTHERGDLFTLLLHPERAAIYKLAIRRLIEQTIAKKQSIWRASMKEIADWWKERASFGIHVVKVNSNQYRINASCSDRVALLMRNGKSSPNSYCMARSNEFNIIKERDFVIETKTKPIIGISSTTSPRLQEFLKNEGFPFEIAQEGEQYAFRIKKGDDFTESQYRHLLNEIDKSQAPLIKIWRWPNEYKSAFSLTFDLDAITLQDFVSRALQFQTR